MRDYVREYRKKTPGSARMFGRSARMHVGGVSHNIRYFEPYPFVVESSAGKRLADVDGNRYTDYWMGHWSLILGHRPPDVRDALASQIRKGWMYGTVNEQTMGLSDLISRAVPAAEKIRYVTSGTEAAMYAVRLARSYTGRKIIAKVDGGWHGYTSDLLKTVNWPFNVAEGTGMTGQDKIASMPYNDLEGSLKVLRRHAGDLAAVIVEPVLGGGGCIPAEPDYLRGIEEFAHRNGSLFMLDEIVTGFRFRYGCLYPTMGLDPDIVTLGKIVGGGMPVGAVCGRDDVMGHADANARGRKERSYIGGGTFSANPATMAAGCATLRRLKSGRAIYERINGLGGYARRELERAFDGRVIVTGMGSLFMTHFAGGGITEITSPRQAARCDAGMLHRYHFKMIAHDGIFLLPGKLGAISAAHAKSDIKAMVLASEGV